MPKGVFKTCRGPRGPRTLDAWTWWDPTISTPGMMSSSVGKETNETGDVLTMVFYTTKRGILPFKQFFLDVGSASVLSESWKILWDSHCSGHARFVVSGFVTSWVRSWWTSKCMNIDGAMSDGLLRTIPWLHVYGLWTLLSTSGIAGLVGRAYYRIYLCRLMLG